MRPDMKFHSGLRKNSFRGRSYYNGQLKNLNKPEPDIKGNMLEAVIQALVEEVLR